LSNPAKSDLLYVDHILECIQRIEDYVGGVPDAAARASFMGSNMIKDAVIRNLQVLAESAGRISPENQALEPEVPWQQVRGFRNILVHQYLGMDVEFVQGVVADDPDAHEEMRVSRSSDRRQ